MTKLTFVKGIEYLNAYYSNFKVDLSNNLVQVVWYEALQHIDDKSFEYLVKEYSKNNNFPPQSPTHLLSHFDNLLVSYSENIKNEVLRLEVEFRDKVYDEDYKANVIVVNYDEAIRKAQNNNDLVLVKVLVDIKQGKIKLDDINTETILPYITQDNQLSLGLEK